MFKKIVCILFLLFTFFNYSSAKDYKRIISLSPIVTDSLYELGLEDNVIAVSIFCKQKNQKKEIIGTLLEPDIEKIISLKPDLIVSSKEGNNKAIVEKLIRLNFNVYVMDTTESFEDICDNFLSLAKFTGKEKIAKEIINNSKNDLKTILLKLQKQNAKKIFWQIGTNPLYTCGLKTFINDYNFYTKTKNIYDDINRRYFEVDFENVLVKNPDIIFILNMGEVSGLDISRWKKYKTINAIKNDKIMILNANDFLIPTPKSFLQAVKLLVKKIYPEIKYAN